jgi:hypothetical protein
MSHRPLVVLCALVLGCTSSHRDADVEDGGTTGRDALAVDATPAIDSGPLAVDDAATADARFPPPDSGLPPGPLRIACGTSQCDGSTEGCLASCLDAADERAPSCVALDPEGRWPAAECPGGRERFPRYWLTCDGAEDCPAGEVCHVLYGSLGQYAYCAACEGTCDLRGFHSMCRGDADCPAAVPHCLPNADLPGYSTCREAS